ncbi:MAG: hypothetical protein R3B72_38060 [Polyangiaceae bacterium]
MNHRWPISLVYASSAGAWLYIIVASIRGGARDTATAALAIALPATALAATHFLKKHRQNDMRADTFCAIDLATEESLTSATFWRFAWHACRVSGVWFWQRDAICRKAMSALKHWRAADSPLSAAHLFADIVDLSPRWIRRTASGQTGLIRPKSLAIAKQRAETQAKRLQESCDDPDVLSWLHQLDATAAEAPAAAPPQAVSAEAPSQ